MVNMRPTNVRCPPELTGGRLQPDRRQAGRRHQGRRYDLDPAGRTPLARSGTIADDVPHRLPGSTGWQPHRVAGTCVRRRLRRRSGITALRTTQKSRGCVPGRLPATPVGRSAGIPQQQRNRKHAWSSGIERPKGIRVSRIWAAAGDRRATGERVLGRTTGQRSHMEILTLGERPNDRVESA